jgi:hypothetical protein
VKNLTSCRGLFAPLALALAAGCATSTTRQLEAGVAGGLVSPEQENQIGLQLKADLDTKQGLVYLMDAPAPPAV